MTRRTAIQMSAVGLLSPGLLGAGNGDRRRLLPRQVRRWAVDLPVPPVLRGTRDGGTDRYVMTQQRAVRQVLPPELPATPVWGYEGQFPGPTVLATRGRPVEVRQVNALSEDVSVHLHGSRSRSVDDGQPDLPIPPGDARTYRYENEQPAATLWYHDHADMRTSEHVYRGLAGMYLLRDPDEDRLGLPSGPFDVPLVLQDRVLDVDGRLVFDDADHTDLLGDIVLVNGVSWPRMSVQPRRYRFRLLVASNSRPYEIGLSGGKPFAVVASDGGLLARPVRLRSLYMFVAERYDVVVDFSDIAVGRSVTLLNLLETGPLRVLVRFDVVRGRPDDSRVPARLSDIDPLVPATAPVDRVWRFGRDPTGEFVINGRTYDPARVDARPQLGRVEVWEFRNEGLGFFHPVHPHLVHFQVLSRDGSAPQLYERGWKDTVFVGEQQVVRIAARFGPHRGRYLLHCHNLVHEDHQMMTQFEVV